MPLTPTTQSCSVSLDPNVEVETLAGLIKPEIITNHPETTDKVKWVKVDMGEPILEGEMIPVMHGGQVINFEFLPEGVEAAGRFPITCVSMGNPHCVIFVDDVQNFPVEQVGPIIENDPFFPNRVNVEFVQIVDRKNLIQRTWERGAGETYACGTGACAVVVAGVLNDFCDREVKISLKGGELDMVWDESSNHVFKTGPATTVFEGEIDI